MRICLATNNAHKVKELQSIIGTQFPIVSLQDIGCTEELPEEQPTIEGNSRQKATYVLELFGVISIADDSGLEVDALNGRPGVDSAYYAGPQRSHDDNIALLLLNLADEKKRSANFKTVITLALSPSRIYQFEGILKGEILRERRGSGGFGYDPVFLPDGSGQTLAEMKPEEKNKISHRARAVEKLINFLTIELKGA